MPAAASARRCAAPVVSPITQASSGRRPRGVATSAAMPALSAGPVGASTTSTPPTSRAPPSSAAASASRVGAATPT